MYERYHSCGKRNRNSTPKEICYGLGDKCSTDIKCGTNKRCWREIKSKHLINKIYYTRQHKKALNRRYYIELTVTNTLDKLKQPPYKNF